MEKDDTDGGSDKNDGLTTYHGMNDRKDVTSTSSGIRCKATERRIIFIKNTTTTAIKPTATRSVMNDKGGQEGAIVHNFYQRKSAFKSSVALEKDDGPF